MLILIAGENNSGKSLYAEHLAVQTGQPRYYIATMRSCNEENEKRIAKHRRQRQGLNFRTLELPQNVGNAPVEPGSTVLLEDVSNLLANAVFEEERTPEDVLSDIRQLETRCGTLLAVTITGLSEEGYEGETAAYIRGLNMLNRALAEQAAAVIEMQQGSPVFRKGEPI